MKSNAKALKRSNSIMNPEPASTFLSPKELAVRWRCGRSSVDRIARLAGMTRLYLGQGKNGMVRYILKEVEAYEQSRMIN